MNALMNFIKDEDGLTVLEYVLGASLLVTALLVLFANYGTALQGKLTATLAKF